MASPHVLESDPDLDALVAQLAAEHNVPGLSVGIVHGDRSIASHHGVTDLANPLPVDADTLFFIGSTTKTLTAVAIVRLVEEGRLALTDKVVQHVPDFKVADPDVTARVTVANLLNHTGGWQGDIEPGVSLDSDALAKYVGRLATQPQHSPLGSIASYSNSGFAVAGRVIEMVTGKSYEHAVTELVLQPLGMTDTIFLPSDAVFRKIAVGHATNGDERVPYRGWVGGRSLNPAGGAMSTMRDQLAYLRFLLHGESDGELPISDDARKLMHVPTVEMRSGITGVGLCLLLGKRGEVVTVGHGGNLNNVLLSTFEFFPEHGLGVTVLSNSRGGRSVGEAVNDWAIEHYLGKPARPLLETYDSTLEELEAYVGKYNVGEWWYALSVLDGQLALDWELPDTFPAEFRASFSMPTLTLVKVGTDQFANAAAPVNAVADFGRDDEGAVAWVRHGMRVAYRI